MTSRFHAPLGAVLLAALAVAGCGGQGGQAPAGTTPAASSAAATSSAAGPAARTGAPWFDEVRAATGAGQVSSACAKLPVDFEVAKAYVPKEVTEAAKIPALGQKGPFTLACEIDAKPAGNLGFLRVWAADKALAGKAGLDGFLAAVKGAAKVDSRDYPVGGVTTLEATYVTPDPLEDGKERDQRVLVVPLTATTLVLELGGLDSDESKEMLPAFVLARQTLKPKA
ncbi:hypothetical protein JOF53_002181 [Crossiella equi]|uniref:Lipoprotein n=1 Tax=Crossiella equi TaxID=130796 RepID=A0ABS5A9P6_9PSEU|nr:lipoprotein [Crossiella equi]MBP2473309.1 hypothetical protein [Crossiella equi]